VHPKSDATRVRDVFTSLGWVRADEAILLHDPSKLALLSAFDRAQAIARQHASDEVVLIFYFSGHGDHDAIHLRGESLPMTELRARVAQVPAALRIAVIDACRTKENLRTKGMTVQPGFAVQLPMQAGPSGTVWLYASADGEAAQESDEIGGALFTYFWLTGLRGAADTNVDGRVSLEESFTYGYSQTLLRSAQSGGVLQRPEARLELTEGGPLILTEVAGPRAQLELPQEGNSLYLVYAVGAQSVIAEVYGVANRSVRLTLPKGRYIVQKRFGARGAATDVTLSPGAVRVLSAADFRAVSGELLAQKGSVVLRPWSIALGNTLFAGTGTDVGNELFARIERRDSGWAYAVAPLGGVAVYGTAFNNVTEWYAGGDISLDRVITPGERTLLRVGLDLRGQWIWQTVRRRDADRLAVAGYPSIENFAGSALGGGLHVAARFLLAPRLYLEGGIRALGLGIKTDSAIDGRLLFGAWMGAGVPF
jgi:hypothetical protein